MIDEVKYIRFSNLFVSKISNKKTLLAFDFRKYFVIKKIGNTKNINIIKYLINFRSIFLKYILPSLIVEIKPLNEN